VSVVVPAFNEAATIVSTVRSLVASEHPVEVVVVDDGFNIDRRVQDAWGVVTTVPGAPSWTLVGSATTRWRRTPT